MRLKNLFLLLFSLVVINGLAADQNDKSAAKDATGAQRASVEKAKRIKNILVNKGDDELTIEIVAERGYRFDHYQLRNPSRLVLDFYDAANRVAQTSIPINQLSVKAVRVGQFKADPMIARVVVDLQGEKPDFKILPQEASLRILFQKAPLAASPNTPAPLKQTGRPQDSQSIPAQTATAPEASRQTAAPGAHDTEQVTTDKPEVPAGDQSTLIERNIDALEGLLKTQAPLPQLPADVPPALPPVPASPSKPEPSTKVSEVKVVQLAVALPQPAPTNGEGTSPAKPAGTTPQSEMSKYTGEPISLDFKDGDLVDFFRLLSQITGLNIVLDPSIKGTISLKMVNVPYDQVFDVVLENNGLDKKIEGNVVRIARKTTLRQEEEERRRLKEAQTLAADTVTKTIRLNYANAENLSKTLTKHLSPKGEIVIDQRTNMLIVKDIPEPMANIERLIRVVDIPQPQVEIEARVVSASRDFARDVGVQLGFVEGNLQRLTVGGPNTYGTIGGTRPSSSPTNTQFASGNPSTGRGQASGQGDSAGIGTGIGSNTPGNFNVNLPAQAPHRFSGMGISLGNIFDTFLLDASITAGEQRGLAKLISQPKVTVQNNTEANVTQGLRFPVQVIQNNTVTVQFFDAALRLLVTPQITEEGTVLLSLKVENNVADFSRNVNNIPSIRTSESRTQVLVPDGGTTVIAGILIDSENRVEMRAPAIASIPIVGNLFKRRLAERNTQEILFFITPRIRKQGV